MFSICKELHPATAVEHSLYCHFYNLREKHLVVAGANVIRVFRLIPEFDPKRVNIRYRDVKNPPKMKLECLSTFTFFGNIMSMQAVMLAGSERDALLLAFKDAKLSVVEYDPDAHDLRTLSLHYFENDEMQGGWTHHYQNPIVRVDPEGRCAVMLAYGRKLVVLPFRRDLSAEETDSGHFEGERAPATPSKAHVLASYTITLKELDEKMDNVVDLQFLHGYYEPTLLILYEPLKTFAGRIAVRLDTCAMVAISLNIQQRVHPVIWSVSNLPFDCTQALPIRKPVGGTLIMSVNAIIYLNQSVPPYGVSVNSLAESSTNFPLKPQPGVMMTLDCAQAAFISQERLVISLKGGELYVLTLFADSMRSVRNFHFDKAASSVLTTCMSVCENNYLFLGSRLGNSLFLRFTEKDSNEQPVRVPSRSPSPITIDDEPISKKKRLDTLGDWMASDVSTIKDIDELEVYGNEAQTSVQLTAYNFEVCDSLLNIGPCGNVSMGEPAFLSEEFSNSLDPDVELVTTSGHGKNGALCVLQRAVRPQVVTTFELPGCTDMWTVIGGKDNEADQDQNHAFMILSREDSSMILQTGQEINEVDNSGFNTQGPTVYAGNLGKNKYIVQVTQSGVRLLQGVDQLQHIPFDLGSPVVHASSADPYIVIMTEDGQVVVLTLREVRGTGRLSVMRPQLHQKSRLLTLCAYCDVSGLFSSSLPEEYVAPRSNKEVSVKEEFLRKREEVCDEDELLYGEPGDVTKMKDRKPNIAPRHIPHKRQQPWWYRYMLDVRPTYWVAVAWENGTLEIYSLPDFQLQYLVKNLPGGARVLVDSLGAAPTAVAPSTAETSTATAAPQSQVRELLLVGLGNLGRRPLLLVRLDEELFIYQAFPHRIGQLKMRFHRIPHGLILKKKLSRSRKKNPEQETHQQEGSRVTQLRYFSNIAGYNGVFIAGPYPHWLFMTSRGELRTHPMGIDGSVTCFAQFQNVNCPQGFLYFNRKSELRICVLPTHLSYDAAWPVRKVPLRSTPHFVSYHLESKTYCVVMSLAEVTNKVYKFNGEDKELSIEERDDRFPFPAQEQFSLQLFSPVSWEAIPNTCIQLEEWEHVTSLRNVRLAYEGTRSGYKGYIALATNYNYGEDITSRGRILIYDIIEVVPEPGQPLTKNRFKQVYGKEQKGPVTALSHVMGFLVSAVGQKIYIWQLKDNDLVGVAFIDTQIFIHQMICVKNLILVADVYKSISLLRFQSEYRTLSLVSRDYNAKEVYSIEFFVDNSQLAFLVSDAEKNLVLYMYQPESRESCGGQKLMRKADFHLGQHVTSFFRIRCKLTDPSTDKRMGGGVDKKHITMFATLDGGVGCLLPTAEKTYRRLLMLQNVLTTNVPTNAGLNPKAFRTFKSAQQLLSNPARSVIDGNLVWQFLSLPITERMEVSKKIGTKVEEIVDDLMEIDRLTAHF